MNSMFPALLSAAVTLIVCLINNHYQRIEAERKQNETISLIKYQICELSEKVDKHNQLIERTYRLEQQQTLTEERLKVANHRIDDLEKGA